MGAPHTDKTVLSSTEQVGRPVELQTRDGTCGEGEVTICMHHMKHKCDAESLVPDCLVQLETKIDRCPYHHGATKPRVQFSCSCHTAEWFHLCFLWR